MFSTPLTSCSIGVATVSATTLALAPGYAAVTEMVGGVTSGYCATGSRTRATRPTRTITTERTVAKIGRSTKKRANMRGALSLLGGRFGCWGCCSRHGHLFGNDLHAFADALDAVDDDPVLRPEARLDDHQAVEVPARLDLPALGHIVAV